MELWKRERKASVKLATMFDRRKERRIAGQTAHSTENLLERKMLLAMGQKSMIQMMVLTNAKKREERTEGMPMDYWTVMSSEK